MNSRGRRKQARADARRIAKTRRELAEKARRDARHKIKNEEASRLMSDDMWGGLNSPCPGCPRCATGQAPSTGTP